MFADDTNISYSSNNPTDVENLVNSSLVNLNRWLIANKLSLNIAKTEFMVIGSRQRLATFDNHELRVTVDSEPVRQVTSTKTLGLTLDKNLTWKNHIEVISEKVSSDIDGLHLTSWRPCWRYNTKEYAINSTVGSSRRGWLTLSAISREIDCKPRIGALKRVRGLIDRETAIKVYKGFIEPYYSYCAPLWDGIGVTLAIGFKNSKIELLGS